MGSVTKLGIIAGCSCWYQCRAQPRVPSTSAQWSPSWNVINIILATCPASNLWTLFHLFHKDSLLLCPLLIAKQFCVFFVRLQWMFDYILKSWTNRGGGLVDNFYQHYISILLGYCLSVAANFLIKWGRGHTFQLPPSPLELGTSLHEERAWLVLSHLRIGLLVH